MKKFLLIIPLLWALNIFGQPGNQKQLAIEYYSNEQYEKAIVRFDHLYKKHPSDEFYDYLLKCYLVTEQYDEGIKLIKKHIKKNRSRSASFYIDLGYVQEKANKTEDKEASFEKVYEMVDQSPNLAYSVSKKFGDYGYNKEALRTFEVAEQRNPKLIFHYQKALVYAELADLENMYREYLNMIDKNPAYFASVQNMIQFSIKQDPNGEPNKILKKQLIERVQKSNNVLYNNLLVWLLIQEKQYDQAFIQLKALDKRLNRNQGEIFNLGKVSKKNKAYPTADKCFDYIIKIGEPSPFYEDALIQKVVTSIAKAEEDPNSNTETYQSLIAQIEATLLIISYPEDVLFLKRQQAHLMAFKLKQNEEAVELIKEAIRHKQTTYPGVPACKLELGDILLSYGNAYDALMYYAQVDKAYPEGEIGQDARFKKAMIAFYQGDFNWAKAQFDVLKMSTTKFIANDALNMSILISDNTFQDEDSTYTALKLFAKSKLLILREDLDSALILLDHIAITYPGHSLQDEILFEKGMIYYRSGETDNAIASFSSLSENYSSSILADEALFYLATIYEGQENKELAMEYYERLFSEHGDSLFASQARDAYRKLRGDELYN